MNFGIKFRCLNVRELEDLLTFGSCLADLTH
jgi:hypothetical protein